MPVVIAPGGPASPALLICNAMSESPQPLRARGEMYLVRIDHHMKGIPLLHGDTPWHLVYTHPLQPLCWHRRREGGQEHVGFGKVSKNMSGDLFGGFPLQGVFREMLANEFAADALQVSVRVIIVG